MILWCYLSTPPSKDTELAQSVTPTLLLQFLNQIVDCIPSCNVVCVAGLWFAYAQHMQGEMARRVKVNSLCNLLSSLTDAFECLI